MDSNEHSIARWVSILYRYGQSYVSKKAEAYNIGSGQCIVLLALFKGDGINQKQLSEYLKIDKASIAKAVQRLVKEGYLSRETDDNDKRAYRVYLTKKAWDIETTLFEVISKWENVLSSGLSETEQDTFLRLLRKMAENASNLE